MYIKGNDLKSMLHYCRGQAEDEILVLDFSTEASGLTEAEQLDEVDSYCNAAQKLTDDKYNLVNENLMLSATRLIKNVANSTDITENAKQDLLAAIHLLYHD